MHNIVATGGDRLHLFKSKMSEIRFYAAVFLEQFCALWSTCICLFWLHLIEKHLKMKQYRTNSLFWSRWYKNSIYLKPCLFTQWDQNVAAMVTTIWQNKGPRNKPFFQQNFINKLLKIIHYLHVRFRRKLVVYAAYI